MDDFDTPATKRDLNELGAQLRSDLEERTAQLRSEFQHGYDDLKETLRDNQTELLKAFYSFAQSSEAKHKDAEVSDSAIRQRLSAVESRLTELEKRLNLPPAA
jgi:predicted  nucleic acid-binding Zn-ribbon protein